MTKIELVKKEIHKEYKKHEGVPYWKDVFLWDFTKEELVKLFCILYNKNTDNIIVETENESC